MHVGDGGGFSSPVVVVTVQVAWNGHQLEMLAPSPVWRAICGPVQCAPSMCVLFLYKKENGWDLHNVLESFVPWTNRCELSDFPLRILPWFWSRGLKLHITSSDKLHTT